MIIFCYVVNWLGAYGHQYLALWGLTLASSKDGVVGMLKKSLWWSQKFRCLEDDLFVLSVVHLARMQHSKFLRPCIVLIIFYIGKKIIEIGIDKSPSTRYIQECHPCMVIPL